MSLDVTTVRGTPVVPPPVGGGDVHMSEGSGGVGTANSDGVSHTCAAQKHQPHDAAQHLEQSIISTTRRHEGHTVTGCNKTGHHTKDGPCNGDLCRGWGLTNTRHSRVEDLTSGISEDWALEERRSRSVDRMEIGMKRRENRRNDGQVAP